jgi:hypothetical protein
MKKPHTKDTNFKYQAYSILENPLNFVESFVGTLNRFSRKIYRIADMHFQISEQTTALV